MPQWGVIVLRFHERPDYVDINCWRRELLTDFAPEDFTDPLMISNDSGEGPIPVDDGSCWMDVGTCCTLYEKGYERGDPDFFVRLAEWIEEHIPKCEVWYGNDCSDESIKPFSESERNALIKYYHEVGHEPYESKFRDLNERRLPGELDVRPEGSRMLNSSHVRLFLRGFLIFWTSWCLLIALLGLIIFVLSLAMILGIDIFGDQQRIDAPWQLLGMSFVCTLIPISFIFLARNWIRRFLSRLEEMEKPREEPTGSDGPE